jgi:protein ImuB
VRLLARPEPITAIAPVPDDPPVQFTWNRQVHRVRHATGPERIARNWWAHPYDPTRPEDEKVRDYYAVENSDGARFWLFRAGLHEGVSAPRWYLHGFFA